MDHICYLCSVFVCYTVLHVPCSLMVTAGKGLTSWLLALLYVMFTCVFVTFPYGVLGQVRYSILSIPNLCILPDFFHCL